MARAEKYHQPDVEFIEHVGNRIRILRKGARLTIEELSAAADINPKYLQRCEKGRENFSISVLYSITKALKITLKDFFRALE